MPHEFSSDTSEKKHPSHQPEVLVSGGGTNLQALIDAEKRGEIRAGKITCVIASKADAYALTRAADNGIKTRVLARRDFPDVKSYSKAMRDALVEENADLVVYAGFMTILDEQDRKSTRLNSSHPLSSRMPSSA